MSAVAPVLIKERMTHEEFMDWCDEDTKADLLMRPPLLEALFCGTIPRAFELDWRRSF